ncbi:Zn-dependent alcohol dehydrogenase [Dactylosporangium salmoneum]|uniref:Zn-dependent alcohol dehydrogenase n=2 Tax=Dactylosporangium salmoneum TaxID=53361 RepID=A0ABN3H897_9ACTN
MRGARDIEITEVAIADPGPHEVRVRTVAAGICATDHGVYTGRQTRPLPQVMGHESAGVVTAVGRDVTEVEVGQHVVTCMSVFCGHCEYCLTGRPALCLKAGVTRGADEPPRLRVGDAPLHQMSGIASWAEELLVHEHAVVAVDPRLPLEYGALMGCGITTGLGAVFHAARVTPGSSVAVAGCGGVGMSIVQGARIAGATQIIAIDTDDAKLKLARTLGATHTLNPTGTDDVVAAVTDLSRGGVEFSFEAIGNARTAQQSFLMLRPGGLTTLVGVQRGNTLELPGGHFAWDRRIQGTYMGSNRFRLDIPRFVDLYFDGRLKLDDFVSERIGLDQIPDALDAFGTTGAVRTVVEFP